MNHKTVILANGAFPKSEILLSILDKAKPIICCDGAVNKLVDSGREPDLIIGDLDSVKSSIKADFSDRLIHIADQNTNDLTKAVNWCVSQGVKRVFVLGATGEREDHTLANIGLLSKYQKQIQIEMFSDNGRFIPISESTTFQSFVGQQVSIFSQTPELTVSSRGLKYPLKRMQLNKWWMGTLNESISDTFTLELDKEGDLIIYLLNK